MSEVHDEALAYQAAKGNLEEVMRLVELGANVNALYGRALDNAIRGSFLPVVRYLSKKGADKDSGLITAISCGNARCAELLISAGARLSDRWFNQDWSSERRINNYFEKLNVETLALLVKHGVSFQEISISSAANGIDSIIYFQLSRGNVDSVIFALALGRPKCREDYLSGMCNLFRAERIKDPDRLTLKHTIRSAQLVVVILPLSFEEKDELRGMLHESDESRYPCCYLAEDVFNKWDSGFFSGMTDAELDSYEKAHYQ